jgi:hypothetical protein
VCVDKIHKYIIIGFIVVKNRGYLRPPSATYLRLITLNVITCNYVSPQKSRSKRSVRHAGFEPRTLRACLGSLYRRANWLLVFFSDFNFKDAF